MKSKIKQTRILGRLDREGTGRIIRAGESDALRHLFEGWPGVARRLRTAPSLVLFLDFDGTLVGLRRRPEEVWLDGALQRVLSRLTRHRRINLCVISGRRRADLARRVRVRGVHYLGLYGWEERDGRQSSVHAHRLLQKAREQMERRVGHLPGIWIEDKKLSFVVHYRGASKEAVRRARGVLREVLGPSGPAFRLLTGKKAVEVLPEEIEGKDAAVRQVIAGLHRPVLPLYVGDDASDEPAFATLRHGITVRVGFSRKTQARFFLRNPREVTSFLEMLEREIR